MPISRLHNFARWAPTDFPNIESRQWYALGNFTVNKKLKTILIKKKLMFSCTTYLDFTSHCTFLSEQRKHWHKWRFKSAHINQVVKKKVAYTRTFVHLRISMTETGNIARHHHVRKKEGKHITSFCIWCIYSSILNTRFYI